MTLPMMTTVVALQAFQRGAQAYLCPSNHGPMAVGTDERSSTGYCLFCQECGHRLVVADALVHTALATSSPDASSQESAVRLYDGSPPRGLLADGTIRTTGWAQVAGHPISSGLWSVLAGFLSGIVISGGNALVPLVTALGGYALWKLCTMKWRPASKAVNTGRTTTAQVTPGELIRMYGTAGPVGMITAIAADAGGRLRLTLDGGREVVRPSTHLLWRVALRD